MNDLAPAYYTTFSGFDCLASGSLQDNASALVRALRSGAEGALLVFDNATGRTVEIDTRGTEEEVLSRLAARFPNESAAAVPSTAVPDPEKAAPQGQAERGRPRLGVVGREVTLLPRHWEWLATQPGGASVALRKLVEQARVTNADKDKTRKSQERAYQFINTIAGNLPGFEEAIRALFANTPTTFRKVIADWPKDVREHALWLAFGHGHEVDI